MMEAIIAFGVILAFAIGVAYLPTWWDDITDGGFGSHPFTWSTRSKTALGGVLDAIYCARCNKRYDHYVHADHGVERID